MKKTNKSLLFGLLITAVLLFNGFVLAEVQEIHHPGLINPELIAPNGVVASAHPLASQAGLEMLEMGGNAIDAAVAAAFAIGVVEPHASGLGGEGVMLIYLAEEGKTIAIDYKGTAPANVPIPEEYDRARRGATAPVVPGNPAGLAMALEKYGTMTLEQVLQPAIRIAEEGFEVYQLLFDIIGNAAEGMNDAALEMFFPEGAPPFPGTLFKQPDLANTFRILARDGVEAFYEGEIAMAIDQFMRENGGYMRLEDLQNYEAIEREPVEGNYRGYTVLSSPPPVSGAVVVNMLNILEGFNLEVFRTDMTQYYHLLAEAMKLSFADYYDYIIDPAYGNTPLEDLMSKEYAAQRRGMISLFEAIDGRVGGLGDVDVLGQADLDALFALELQPAAEALSQGSTTQLVSSDPHGNIVSVTQTISLFMGSRTVVPELGFLLNCNLGLFNDDPDDVGRIEPGKRTRSMLVPTLVLDGDQPFLALGTPGAARIPSTLVMTIVNIIDHGMGLQEAIEAPRMTCLRAWLHIEERVDEAVPAGLEALGHPVRVRTGYDDYFGGVQALIYVDGVYYAGADPRRAGSAVGF